jgi:exosome complex component RRP41
MTTKTTKKGTKGKRLDGRGPEDLRDMDAKVSIIPRADGSAMFRSGNTVAIAGVYGPRELHPKFLQNPERGVLRCHYSMMSFSTTERVRPGPNRRSREISMVIEKALTPVLHLEQYPNSVIDVFIQMIQTDAGTRCAGITAAALALADAGIPMKDMVSSVAVGVVNGTVVADLTKEEEDVEGTVDIPLAFLPRTGEVTLLQMDGKLSQKHLKESLLLGKKVSKKIYDLQKKAIKESYHHA